MGDTQIGVGGPDRLGDQAAVLDQIAGLAVERQVDVVLHGGDVFEGPTVSPEQLEVFASFVRTLSIAEIPLVAVSGNGRHDLAMRTVTALGIFAHIPGALVATRPEVLVAGGVAIACLPWVHPGILIAARGGDRDEISDDVAALLIRIAEGLREECARVAPHAPAVLLAHWSISGAALPTGLPVDQLREPILPLAALEELGFDAVVASHIHKPQLLTNELGGGPVFYTGAPQHHDHGDDGQERGVWLVDVERPLLARPTFVPLESRPFVTAHYAPGPEHGDHSGPHYLTFDGEAVARGAIVRLQYTATAEQARRIDNAELRRDLLDAGAHTVTIQATIERAQTARIAALDDTLDELAALDLFLTQHTDLQPLADRMRASTGRYLTAVSR